MTKIFSMFMITTLLALSIFAIFFAISPVNEREKTLSSQGVYMLQNTKIVKNDEELILTVGGLYLDESFNIHKIVSIRMTHTGEKYVVSTSKDIYDYKSMEEYQSAPYKKMKVNNIDSFVIDKRKITIQDIFAIFLERFATARIVDSRA